MTPGAEPGAEETGGAADAPRRALWLAPVGAAIAVVSAMCGIGGGLFTVPVLHFGRRLALRAAVATALVLVLSTAAAATVTEALRVDSALRGRLVAALVVGALVGAQLGYLFGRRLSASSLRKVFVVVLFLAGLRMILNGSADAAGGGGAAAAAFVLDAPAYALALAIGLGGGFVAPLLGVGGGLILVPALFVGFPALGFAGARACSLAVAVFSALRSIWLYAREGLIRWSDAAPLAAGALAGAAGGVLLVHRPGWVDGARVLLALVLWGVAVRFTLELGRDRARARS